MKRYFFVIIAALFFLVPAFQATAQYQYQTQTTGPVLVSTTFDMSGFPQWTKDIRRWEIIAFGTFPFTFLISTFAMDMYRWGVHAGMSFSGEGLRYAPWPLKGAGAYEMSNYERELTFIMAASFSAVLAFVDLIIIKIREHKERRRIERLGPGTSIITRRPYADISETDGNVTDKSSGDITKNPFSSSLSLPEFQFRPY